MPQHRRIMGLPHNHAIACHRKIVAVWCCAMLLRCCHCFSQQSSRAVIDHMHQFKAAPSPAEAPAGLLPASRTGNPQLPTAATPPIPRGDHAAIKLPGTVLHRSKRARQLRAYKAAAETDLGRPKAGVLPYPQEHTAVLRYLQEGASSGGAPFTIPVWFVVVAEPNNVWGTNVTERQLQAQIDLLNNAYATGLPGPDGVVLESGAVQNPAAVAAAAAKMVMGPGVKTYTAKAHPVWTGPGSNMRLASHQTKQQHTTGQLWRFALKGIRYTTSRSPMCVGSTTEQSIKSAWRHTLVSEGRTVPDRTLVVYVSDITAAACKGAVAGYSVMFGYSNSPYDLVFWKQHEMEYRDGVVMDPEYLLNPGVQKESGSGMLHGAATGAQLVHEVGHWMGLSHTFDGGCTTNLAASDQVQDTPAEANPKDWGGVDLKDASGGCSYRDSCGNVPGQDIYYNYMTYNNLACAKSFTPGQQARMLYLFRAVRKD